jgi:hypothetical protein
MYYIYMFIYADKYMFTIYHRVFQWFISKLETKCKFNVLLQ